MLRIIDLIMKWLRFVNPTKSNHSVPETDDLQKLQQELKIAHEEVLALEAKIGEYQWLEQALRTRTRELNERMKELECLYTLSSYFTNCNLTLDQILHSVVKEIPYGWQNPEATFARIVLDGREYKSSLFHPTTLKQSVFIYNHGKRIGILEVFIFPGALKNHEKPFLNEEQRLLNAIALWIGEMVVIKK